jgi:mono/diheme cytochrome c family protein
MKALKASFAIIFAVIFSVACGTTNEPANRNVTPAPNSNTGNSGPVATVTNANLSAPAAGGEMKPAASGDTAKVYAEKCAMCHGEDGKGIQKGSPDFTNAEWQKKETDAEFTEVIKAGKKPMPGFEGKLSDDQIKSLVQYVRAFAKK